MTYQPPHKRYRAGPEKKKYASLNDADDFPPLGATGPAPQIPSVWGDKKSFKEIVENNEVTFNYDILERKAGETDAAYFSRLSLIYKRTTTLAAYNIYTVTGKNKSYKVAARHEIIARLLCQMEDNRYSMKASSEAYDKFRQDTLEQMYVDDEMWDEVMGSVGNDSSKREKAIRAYYNNSRPRGQGVTFNWMDPRKATCKKGIENCISKEKIIY